jgi:microcystin-dependent protein
MEAFLGTVVAVGFNFVPAGWAFCNGQLLSISQNPALFSLLSTMYGGDGVTTFGLPDLRGRAVAGSQGNGPGVASISQGQLSGAVPCAPAPVQNQTQAVATQPATGLNYIICIDGIYPSRG